MKRIAAVLVFLFVFFSLTMDTFAEQKIVFCADSVRYGKSFGSGGCNDDCQPFFCKISDLTSNGWRIVTFSAAEKVLKPITREYIPPMPGYPVASTVERGCVCVGREFLLEK